MDKLIEVRRRSAAAQAESHRKMLELCRAFRAQLEHAQPRLSPAVYTYAQSLETLLLRVRGL